MHHPTLTFAARCIHPQAFEIFPGAARNRFHDWLRLWTCISLLHVGEPRTGGHAAMQRILIFSALLHSSAFASLLSVHSPEQPSHAGLVLYRSRASREKVAPTCTCSCVCASGAMHFHRVPNLKSNGSCIESIVAAKPTSLLVNGWDLVDTAALVIMRTQHTAHSIHIRLSSND